MPGAFGLVNQRKQILPPVVKHLFDFYWPLGMTYGSILSNHLFSQVFIYFLFTLKVKIEKVIGFRGGEFGAEKEECSFRRQVSESEKFVLTLGI